MQTFLEEIKAELCTVRGKKECCERSELRALLMFGGAVFDGGVLFGTESYDLAKRFSVLLRHTCAINLPERVDENAGGYKFVLPDDILSELFLTRGEDAVIEEKDDEDKPCCRRAFIRGAFLASGSASNPEKTYRIEIFSQNKDCCEKALNILRSFDAKVNLTKRKSNYVVYANTGESVGDVLKIAEATGALFRVLQEKAVKDTRNSINRQTNCDMANSDRAVDTSYRQRKAIKKLTKSGVLETLSPKLIEAARLRMENPLASTSELAKMAGISKSAMYARLENLVKIAENGE